MKKREIIQLPIVVLKGMVVLPESVSHFEVQRELSKNAIKHATENQMQIFLVTHKDMTNDSFDMKGAYQIGTITEVKQVLSRGEGNNGTVRVVVESKKRARVIEVVDTKEYLTAIVEVIEVPSVDQESPEIISLIRTVKNGFEEFANEIPNFPAESIKKVLNENNPVALINTICSIILLEPSSKQEILEKLDIKSQLFAMDLILQKETEIVSLQLDVMEQVNSKLDTKQREFFIKEQIKALQQHLGNETYNEELTEVEAFDKKILGIKNISDEAREKLLKECERLSKTISFPQEAAQIRSYIETCLSLPWDQYTKEKIDIEKAKKILDRDHYGLEKVKERILETLSVRKLAPNIKGQIICLVGPPGVGKTSIAQSIAQTLGRKYARVSLGGVRDEADIRGHRKTYLGAMPGRIINALITSKSCNPLILLDEIDKMSNDFRGDPASAMLEVLDSEQHVSFRDHFVEFPFDLSDVLFITTANSLSTIPGPLRDRMEIIELSSYTREEKFNIAKIHLIPKQLKRHGLTNKTVSIKKPALYNLIDCYVKEAGVRSLERNISALCRKSARKIVGDGATKVDIDDKMLVSMLGQYKYINDDKATKDEVGVVSGLAWTSVGGEMLEIEVAVLDGTGKIKVTGSLGDVMKESSQIAVSIVRGIASKFNIDPDFYKNKDIHIHAPEGAVPKDGPSAGVTMVTALVSALSNTPVNHKVAMTGEVSLRGNVLPIGGLKEKSMAAYRAGKEIVVIPKNNLPDLEDIDETVKEKIKFIPATTVFDVLEVALVLE